MTWQQDADYVGIALGEHGWDVALRIARSVEPGEGKTANLRHGNSVPDRRPATNGKVSIAAFARRAGTKIGSTTVRRYYHAWELAAWLKVKDANGKRLPPAAKLTLDSTFDFSTISFTPLDEEKPINFRTVYADVERIPKWLAAEETRRENVERHERHVALQEAAGVSREEYEKPYVPPGPDAMDRAFEYASEEAGRREAIRKLQRLAHDGRVAMQALAQEYQHTGVADEVGWLHEMTADLTEWQWASASFIVEPARKSK